MKYLLSYISPINFWIASGFAFAMTRHPNRPLPHPIGMHRAVENIAFDPAMHPVKDATLWDAGWRGVHPFLINKNRSHILPSDTFLTECKSRSTTPEAFPVHNAGIYPGVRDVYCGDAYAGVPIAVSFS
jgi:hypothetical protein